MIQIGPFNASLDKYQCIAGAGVTFVVCFDKTPLPPREATFSFGSAAQDPVSISSTDGAFSVSFTAPERAGSTKLIVECKSADGSPSRGEFDITVGPSVAARFFLSEPTRNARLQRMVAVAINVHDQFGNNIVVQSNSLIEVVSLAISPLIDVIERTIQFRGASGTQWMSFGSFFFATSGSKRLDLVLPSGKLHSDPFIVSPAEIEVSDVAAEVQINSYGFGHSDEHVQKNRRVVVLRSNGGTAASSTVAPTYTIADNYCWEFHLLDPPILPFQFVVQHLDASRLMILLPNFVLYKFKNQHRSNTRVDFVTTAKQSDEDFLVNILQISAVTCCLKYINLCGNIYCVVVTLGSRSILVRVRMQNFKIIPQELLAVDKKFADNAKTPPIPPNNPNLVSNKATFFNYWKTPALFIK